MNDINRAFVAVWLDSIKRNATDEFYNGAVEGIRRCGCHIDAVLCGKETIHIVKRKRNGK